MPVKIDVLGIKEITSKLDKLPEEVADIAIADVQDYFLNVMRSDQPTPNFISRKAAYGETFSSDRQRKWFFANLNDGSISVPYRRTQKLSQGWHIVKRGLFGYVVNNVPGAVYVIGSRKQSRHEAMVGWKTVQQQIRDRTQKIKDIIDGSAKRAIKKLGL